MACFDAYEHRYEELLGRSVAIGGRPPEFYTALKVRHLRRLIRDKLGDPSSLRVLDLGCGPGLTDALLERDVGLLVGADVSSGMLAQARRRNAGTSYALYDGGSLPFRTGGLDAVFAVCVLHHVEPCRRDDLLREMARVTRRGGVVAIYEHNPWNPLTRWVVARCEFDRGVVLESRASLFRRFQRAGLRAVHAAYLGFLPFGGERARRLEDRLAGLPLGAQYCLAGTPNSGLR